MLAEFHDKYRHHSGSNIPTIPPNNVKELRWKLIEEEAQELVDAIKNDNMVEIADGIADLCYVAIGCAIAYFIPIDDIFAEVHRSNMTKSMLKDEKSIKGKTVKGPNFEPPNIRTILETWGWKDEQTKP